MFDNKYPYTDFHELNLDWFMGEFKKLVAEWEETKGEWNTLHDYVQNYFENLNVQTEINNKINAMILDGTFADIVSPFVTAALPALVAGQLPDVVAAQISSVVAAQISAVVADQLPAVAAAAAAQEVGTWLAAHIDPDTGYVIDSSLTVSNAAADAAVTGSRLINAWNYEISKDANKNAHLAYSGLPVYRSGYYMNSSGTEVVSANHQIIKIPGHNIKALSFTALQNFSLSIFVVKKNDVVYAYGSLPSGATALTSTFLTPLDDDCELYLNWYNSVNGTLDYLNDVDIIFESDTEAKIIELSNVPSNSLYGTTKIYNKGYFPVEKGWMQSNGNIVTTGHSHTIINGYGIKSIKIEKVGSHTNILPYVVAYIDGVYSSIIPINIDADTTYTFSSPLGRDDILCINWFDADSGGAYADRFTLAYLPIDDTSDHIYTDKSWASIGDSITWLNDNGGIYGRPDYGYQTRLQRRITFGSFTNLGVNGATMLDYNINQIIAADIYTIALGINDWGETHKSPVGTLSDYINADGTQSINFAQCLKRMILKIRSVKSDAYIILMTPRRAYGFEGFLPDHSTDANTDGVYLHDYVDIINQVGSYEGYPVVDQYHNEGIYDGNLTEYSYDVALHPNDAGMQIIANLLYPKMEQYLRTV